MGSGGTVKIDIASSPEAPGLRVSIQDQGRGIPSEILPRLGELGFTFKKPGGSGLGLHHAKTTLERFGGSLQIKSSLGVGTLIALEFMKYDTTRA
jgi:signal transduction histidine kinase